MVACLHNESFIMRITARVFRMRVFIMRGFMMRGFIMIVFVMMVFIMIVFAMSVFHKGQSLGGSDPLVMQKRKLSL